MCKCPIQNFFSFSVLYEQPTTTKKTAEKETKKQPKLRSSQKKRFLEARKNNRQRERERERKRERERERERERKRDSRERVEREGKRHRVLDQ